MTVCRVQRLIFALLVAFMLNAITAASAAFAAEYYMSPSGDDSNDGQAPDRPWRTMTKVYQMQGSLKSGDTVYFKGGDYVTTDADRSYYPLTANGVTYKNYLNEKPYIVQDRRVPSPVNHIFPTIIYLSGDNIVFDGINLRQSPESRAIAKHHIVINGLRYGNAQGMTVYGNNVTVKNCSITNFSASAMGGGGKNFLMEHCYLATSGHGSYITGQNGTYRYNVYNGVNGYFNQFGVQVQFPTSRNNRIYGNLMINGQSAGLVLSGGAGGNEIFNNIIINGGNKLTAEPGKALVPGTALAFVCYSGLALAAGNKIYNNTFIGKSPGGLIADSACSVSMGQPVGRNVEIYNNIFHPSPPVRVGLGTPNVRNNIFYNVSSSVPPGNINADPKLANPNGTQPLDAMLTTGSTAAIDKAISGAPGFDYQNGARPFGPASDIGAFEFGSAAGSGGPVNVPPPNAVPPAVAHPPSTYNPDASLCP